MYPEASLIVPDFTISVYCSSCSSLFFYSFSLSFSLSICFLVSHPALSMQKNRKRMERSMYEAEHELCRTQTHLCTVSLKKTSIITLVLKTKNEVFIPAGWVDGKENKSSYC